MDAVQKANSGHPGTPMALAPVAYTLWHALPALRSGRAALAEPRPLRALLRPRLDAALRPAAPRRREAARRGTADGTDQPAVPPRRHQAASASSDSVCPGHPEYGHTTGVETTTGPLGQGVGNSVGMAIAERWLAARYNRRGFTLFDYNVYAICSDGDMMEGVASEAASLAGHLKLVQPVLDLRRQHDHHRRPHRAGLHRGRGQAVRRLRLERAARSTTPTICEALPRAIEAFRRHRRPADADHRPQRHRLRRAAQAGHRRSPRRPARRGGGAADQAGLRLAGGRAVPGARRRASSASPRHRRARAAGAARGLGDAVRPATPGSIPISPRRSSCMRRRRAARRTGTPTSRASRPTPRASPRARPPGKVLNAIAQRLPVAGRRLGRSGALDQDTCSTSTDAGDFEPGSYGGRNMHFGIREHAMGAIVNGMALSRPARLSAPPSSSSPTTCGRRSGWRRSWACR